MSSSLLERIVGESNVPDLVEILSERLTPTDLQSLLLKVYSRRAARITPTRLLEQYEQNRFVRPSPTDPLTLIEFDRLAFGLAVPLFTPIELSPVCPLGTSSVVATVSQNKTIATTRNTETVADSTNVMALECALRRRRATDKNEQVRLCSSHRLLRTQTFNGPGAFAHFRLFGLCTAGRTEASSRFEKEALSEHLDLYLRLFAALKESGYGFQRVRVVLTDFGEKHGEPLRDAIRERVGIRFPEVAVEHNPDRETGSGYYDGVCFHIYATDRDGNEQFLADGGFTDWTQQLLSNKKERLLISGIGTERICSVFAPR